MRCGGSGNLYTLRQKLGLSIPGVASQKDWSASEKKVDPLPDIEEAHSALMQDADALDYLINIRGLSKDIIIKQKLGLIPKHFFRETGEVRALCLPYLVNNNCTFVHYRTLPDPNDLKKIPKAFSSPKGREAGLYNGEILKDGLKEVIFFEGEMDTLAAMNVGIENVCGVPGANFKKASWIDTLDSIGVEKVYICYDSDRVGRKAAQELASRVGIEKCWKIVLPDFEVTTETGELRKGKDINEWLMHGGTAEEFENLKNSANMFDVDGVSSSNGAVEEFLDELDSKGAGQKYSTPWPSLSAVVQFDSGDIIHVLGEAKSGKSTWALNLLEYEVNTYGEDGCFICLEMTRAKMARKWLCHKAGINDVLPKTQAEADALTAVFKDAIPKIKEQTANRAGDIFFCYPAYKSAEDIYKLITDCIRRYGIRWFVVDNLQLLCDTTIGNKGRTQYMSEISKMFTKIAKDYNVQIIVILQPHRIAQGKMVSEENVDGSSQTNKDCDVLLVINRSKKGEVTKEVFEQGGFIQTEGSFNPEMLIRVGLSRYSAGGSTTLYFDGATSTVFELTEGKIAAMNAKANPNVGYEKQAAAMNLPLDMLKKAVNNTPATPNPEEEGAIII
jgi:twinkle protein